jgi:small conductance mechanosensitive channel
MQQAIDVLKQVAEQHDLVLEKPEVKVDVDALADSSVNLILRPWVRTEDYWDAYWDLTEIVKKRFDEEGITIPFPQRDVHTKPA